MKIGTYSYEEFVQVVKSFHGTLAPGLLIGGFMVDLALKNVPDGELFDSICETQVCLPDAVQLLTPCTIGNGWLKVFDFGKFAVTLYEKYNGEGIRVYLDIEKLKGWPEVDSWFFKLKPKREQDSDLLMSQIKEAGHSILSMQRVKVEPEKLVRKKAGPSLICPQCGEAYPAIHGEMCRNCAGGSPFVSISPL